MLPTRARTARSTPSRGERASPPPAERRAHFVIAWPQIIGAGFLATAMGMNGMKPESLDMAKMLATLITRDPQLSPTTHLIGSLWNFANGIVFAIAYALVLKRLGRQSTIVTGFWLGTVLWVLSMTAVPALVNTNSLVTSGKVQSPGMFLFGMQLGWAPSLFVLIDHLVFGLLVGVLYKHRERERPEAVRGSAT